MTATRWPTRSRWPPIGCQDFEALFLGELTPDECEISWIAQGDLAPALSAFGNLARLEIRGGAFTLSQATHARLRTLIVESGGLDPGALGQIVRGDFPNLEFLELWLGDPNYGGEATVDDLRPLLDGERFPRLRRLGLRNCAFADELAAVLVESPLLPRLEALDLSLGTLSDTGADVLLASPAVARLKQLDIHFHYVSPERVQRLEALEVEVDASEPQQPAADGKTGEELRYCAVGE